MIVGKITGFMDYERKILSERAPCERIKDFNEFHDEIPERERRRQGGRCMDCGVPFCQAGMIFEKQRLGCPLNNLIPEWNDMLWEGNYEHALSRLLKTACFPEFTGRVCPALCERACTCGRNGDPVTVRDNELSIIEFAFKNGLMEPKPPVRRSNQKIAVIGSGPSGLATAYYLNRRGHSVTVFEKDDAPGGLLMYGIPNMKLDKSIVERRVKLMSAEGIEFKLGCDVGKDITVEQLDKDYDAIVFCCGARKPRPLAYEGEIKEGVIYALDYLSSATKALLSGTVSEYDVKGKKVAIVGAGDSASDCVGTAVRQGCESLIQLVRKPASFYAGKTDYAHDETEELYKKDIRMFETTVVSVKSDKDGKLCSAVLKTPQGQQEVELDTIIVASGFSGAEDYVLEAKQSVSNSEKVFAAGDMINGATLVVVALADGKHTAANVDRYLMGYTNIE